MKNVIRMKLSEIDECEVLFDHYFCNGDSVITLEQAIDRETQAFALTFKVDEKFGVAIWESCTGEDDIVEVLLFDDKIIAEKHFDYLVKSETEKRGYSVIVSDESEKRVYLEAVMEKELFEELEIDLSVVAKLAQNDSYEYQVYTEDCAILLVDKFEGNSSEVKKALELVEELNIISLQKRNESWGFNRYLEIQNEDGDEISITLSPAVQHSTNRNYLAMFKNQIIKEFAE